MTTWIKLESSVMMWKDSAQAGAEEALMDTATPGCLSEKARVVGSPTQGRAARRARAAQHALTSSQRRPLAVEAVLLALVAIAVIILGLAMSGPAVADDLPQAEYKAWAGKQALAARKARAELVRMTDALGLRRPAPLPTPAQYTVTQLDVTSGAEIVFVAWRDFGLAAQKAARACRTRAAALHRRLVDPSPKSGASRWWPLALYVGWPKAQRRNVVRCIRGESGGNPRCTGALGEAGLMQIHPCHASTFRRVTGKPFYRAAWSPEPNLRFALWLWRGSGWRPWSVMR